MMTIKTDPRNEITLPVLTDFAGNHWVIWDGELIKVPKDLPVTVNLKND